MTATGATVDEPSLPRATPPAAIRALLLPQGRRLILDRPRVMGVINITPDSFSDGGRHFEATSALERAREMVEEGVDLIDLGAESTRPGGGVYGAGAAEVEQAEEIRRLRPVLEALRRETDLPISVDTRKAAVAGVAIELGADIINDVSALADPAMADCLAASQAALVLMHSRGDLATMQVGIHFRDVLEEVRSELSEKISQATEAGIGRDRLVLDPGIGFGKTARQNLTLISRLGELAELGLPLLLGASRKSFLNAVHEAEPKDRLAGSLAAAAVAIAQGADILRVHDVAETRQFVDTWLALSDEEAS